jgi:DNA polymerase II small subunit
MANILLKECMKKGFLLDKEMLNIFNNYDDKIIFEIIKGIEGVGLKERVITRKIFCENLDRIKIFINNFSNIKDSFSDLFNLFDSNINLDSASIIKKQSNIKTNGNSRLKVKLISAPAFVQRKICVGDFIKHFRSRFEIIKSILEKRDFDDLTSIRKIGNDKGSYTIIASILDKRHTKNKNLMLTVEDLTGTSTVLINQNKKEVFEKASSLLLDDIVAFSVSGSGKLLFCNDLFFPEASILEKKRYSKDLWVAIISDLHCGSKHFLEKEFLSFIKWINDEKGKYKDITGKIGYLFVIGDLIDGVNHYPGQENDLNIFSCIGQYKKFEELIKLIKKDIEIVICPGNHDAVWVGEPQPIISDKWAPGLYELDNVHLVPSPSLVEIEGDYKILMYHGSSINAFVEEIPEIRTKYGRSQPTLIVSEMIKRRHLAPMHGLVDYIPCEIDPMVIDPVPDIILTGDLHVLDIGCKNNILMIASSCWQSLTSFMEKVGVKPDPCKVPLFNLKTREIKIIDFSDSNKEVEWDCDNSLFCKLNDVCEEK